MIWIDCEHCDEQYHAVRSSRKYCSNSCKTMAYRERRKQEENEIIMLEYTKVQLKEVEKMRLKWKLEDDERAKRRQKKELEQAEEQRQKDIRRQQEELEQAEKKQLKDEQREGERIEKRKREQADSDARKVELEKKYQENELLTQIGIAALSNFLEHWLAPRTKQEAPPEPNVDPGFTTGPI